MCIKNAGANSPAFFYGRQEAAGHRPVTLTTKSVIALNR